MNLAELQKKLMAAARNNTPDDHVPYAFEKRVMAHLGRRQKADPWASFATALWCGAAACTAIAVATSVWLYEPAVDPDGGLAFAQDLEQTILIGTDDGESVW